MRDNSDHLKFLIEQSYKEVAVFWTRTNVFLVVETAALGAVGSIFTHTTQGATSVLTLAFAALGALSCLVWFQAVKMSRHYNDVWLRDARRLAAEDETLTSIYFISLGFREQARDEKPSVWWQDQGKFYDLRRPWGPNATKCVYGLIIGFLIIWVVLCAWSAVQLVCYPKSSLVSAATKTRILLTEGSSINKIELEFDGSAEAVENLVRRLQAIPSPKKP